MDRQPVLEGERLILRPLREADWVPLYALAADPAVWELHPLPDRWQEPVFRRFFEEGLASGGGLTAIDRQSAQVVGSSRFTWREPPNEADLEIGSTFIGRAWWGTGVNAEMKRLMLGHALRSVPRVVFRVGEYNTRSRAAMARIGGRLVGDPFTLHVQGRALPHVLYQITREDFAAGPLSAPGASG